jgi:hypothetical protein
LEPGGTRKRLDSHQGKRKDSPRKSQEEARRRQRNSGKTKESQEELGSNEGGRSRQVQPEEAWRSQEKAEEP